MPRHLKQLLTLTVSALFLLAGESLCAAAGREVNDKELKKAEKVLAKLNELQEAAARPDSYKTIAKKLYPDLFINVAGLRDGDLKMDLTTAVFLHEKAYALLRDNDLTIARCDNEARDLYRNLCTARASLTRAQLLIAKARLHWTWAAATIRFHRGQRDSETIAIISDIRKERAIDLSLAERSLVLLKSVDEKVDSYSSLGEFEERGRIAHVSFDELSKDFKTVAAATRQLLSSLPRSPLYYNLQNALSSYSDGLFWWQKTYTRKQMVVNANNWTEPAKPLPLGFEAAAVNYTVVCNWRNARKYIASAVIEIERAREKRPDAE
ncbi:MAG TPA: hypothetical protein VF791_17545 [Pyrinomonadaceae bacterium]